MPRPKGRSWRTNGRHIGMVIQPEVRDVLEKRAKRADLSLTQYIRRVLRHHVEQQTVAVQTPQARS
jgi:hypothetical protein